MSLVGSIYDPSPIQPVAKISENLSIFTGGAYHHYQILFEEPVPRGSPFLVNILTVGGLATLAAGATDVKRLVAVLQLNNFEFVQFRFQPIDDIEVEIFEQPAMGRFETRGARARISLFTEVTDPYMASSTVFVLGSNRDLNIQVTNPSGYVIDRARIAFWGIRYLLKELANPPERSTWLPAEGAATLDRLVA